MKKFTACVATLLSLVIAFTATTLAWFSTKTVVDFPSSYGSTQASYFAGGDGSEDTPYLISSPVHLYNLAWLQYLGYFNMREGFNNGRAQNYFRLSNSINLGGMAIPPIGTQEYPFIGNFDGNGKTINSFTVSNLQGDLTQRPKNATFGNGLLVSSKGEAISIVGIFGVTGDYNGFVNGAYKVGDIDIYEFTEQGDGSFVEGLVSGCSGDKDDADVVKQSKMKINGFYANGLHIKSAASKTLVGLVAGYVCSTVTNAGVYTCDVVISGAASGLNDDYGSVVSKYSIVGDYDESVVGWTEKPVDAGGEEGDGAAWGGSIDMRTLNRRLNYMITKAGTVGSGSIKIASSSYGLNAQGSSSEYYWNINTDSYKFLYLNEGTVLPLNVDNEAMGLNDKTEIVVSSNGAKNGFHYNEYYQKNDVEKVGAKNTGYIVSDGTQTRGYIRPRMQPLASSYDKGIYKSLGYTTTKEGISYDDTHKSRLEMLTVIFNADGTRKTYRIQDDVNKDNTVTAFSGVTRATYSALGLYGYANVRDSFDSAMSGAYMVHGFHFMNKLSTTAYNTVKHPAQLYNAETQELETLTDYPLIMGGINFTLAQSGSIKVILGTYFTGGGGSGNTMFDLYRVERKSSATGGYSIKSFKRISKVYRDSSGKVVYDPSDTTGLTLVYDFDAVTRSSTLERFAAYYFEIPVTAGDYVIASDVDSTPDNAYLMYLDIGANGNGDSEGTAPGVAATPYTITTVDFVTVAQGSEPDSLEVPTDSSGNAYYPSYQDVTFNVYELSGDSSKLEFKRNSYEALPVDNSTPIATKVWISYQNAKVVYTPRDGLVEDSTTSSE